ncbi:MAG: hypothetical protein DI585_01200 [Pseudomonas fluorescens]|nr:MAG: hypothetical protein DI585_01200 [Pseudomonas fluorescens]
MSELSELNADNLVKIWNNTYGGRVNEVLHHALVMQDVTQCAAEFSPDLFVRDIVMVTAKVDGREVTEPVECCFARFGSGADTQWAVFQWYQTGYAEAVRPYTKDTANMPWMLEYIEKTFAA